MDQKIAEDNGQGGSAGSGNPYIDHLLDARERLVAGSLDAEEFRKFIREKKELFITARKELDQNYKEEFAREIECVRKAYIAHNEGVDVLEKYLDGKSRDDLERGIRMVTEAARNIKEGLATLAINTLTASPTRSPHVNFLINACEAAHGGKIDNSALSEALEYFRGTFRKIRSDVENLTTVPTDSTLVQEELPHMMDALDRFEGALQELDAYFQDGDKSRLPRAIEILRSATEDVRTSQEAFENIGETEGKIRCVKCQSYNYHTSILCDKCGARLPRMAGVGVSSFQTSDEEPSPQEQRVMTEHMKRLYEAVNAVAEGEISDEEFRNTLDWMENLLTMAESQLAEVSRINPEVAPSEQRQAAEQEAEIVDDTKKALHDGIVEFRRGLEMLQSFLENRSREVLVEGIRITYEAAQQIYAVQMIGEMAMKSDTEAGEVKPETGGESACEFGGTTGEEEAAGTDQDGACFDGMERAQDKEAIIDPDAIKKMMKSP